MMTRGDISQPQAVALDAARRLIANGQRPAYRLKRVRGGAWVVREAPWLSFVAQDRPTARAAATKRIAALLGCEPWAFDLDVEVIVLSD